MTNPFLNHDKGIKTELSRDLGEMVVQHRNNYHALMSRRYREFLPVLIQYQDRTSKETDYSTSIDYLKLEVALSHGRHVAVGLNSNSQIVILGYVKNTDSVNNPANLLSSRRRTEEDIEFTIPYYLQLPAYTEITHQDGASTGQFVVLSNKAIDLVSDVEIIEHYINELAEIQLSRFSLILQAKILTFFKSNINDQTIDEIVSNLYNGKPYSKVSKLFDPEEQIYTFDNAGIVAQNLVELKHEYQNKISELNNGLGINSLAVEKASGISDVEARSNTAFTTSNANLKLSARNNPIELLNKRFGIDIEAVYNDEVSSELSHLNIDTIGGGIGEKNSPIN